MELNNRKLEVLDRMDRIAAIKFLERLLDDLVSAGFCESKHDGLRAVIEMLRDQETKH